VSTRLIFDNLVAYSLQIGLLVGVAAAVPAVLRLRQPGARLVYWQILLAACLLLPLQPWKQVAASGTVEVTTVVTAIQPVHRPAPSPALPRSELVLLVVMAGMAIRLGWLAAGFWKLRRYRRHAEPLAPAPAWGVEAPLLVSEDVAGPVTFGWRKPVVLLPATFPALEPQVQEAILCHEIMHVRRGDWLFTVAEELVRAVFWFHPAIWWLLGEIGLAREQEVDRLAIEITHEREEYMDALLAIAGARAQLDLAPAPLFLRKRHLRQRVILILKEARMSKTHLISTLATGLAVLAAACWLVTGAFPLTAQPQVANDAAGVTVSTNGAAVMHRTGVSYPAAALQHGVQGAVSVELKLDAGGNVSDARVLSGPDELRRAALESVLQWHFAHEVAGTTRVVQISFELPPQSAAGEASLPAPAGVIGGVIGGVPGGVGGGVAGGVIDGVPAGVLPLPAENRVVRFAATAPGSGAWQPGRIASIQVIGLSDPARDEVLGSLPVHEGDELTSENFQQAIRAVNAIDEHLAIRRINNISADGTAQTNLIISPQGMTIGRIVAAIPPPPPPGTPSPGQPSRIKVGGNVQSAMIVSKVPPVYPELAKSARVEGVVHLTAIIGKDGTILELHSIGGPALLIQSAMDAVRQWVYQVTYLNGEPVAVETTIDVNFTLSK
jgi:TonB family protein